MIYPAEAAAAESSLARRLDARVKLLSLLGLLIVAVTTPPDAYFAFAGYFALLLAFAVAAGVSLRALAARYLVLIAFVALAAVLIPFLHQGEPAFQWGWLKVSRPGLLLFWNATAKASIGIVCALLLGATTPFPELLHALERLRLPRVLVALVGFTYRYLFVLADEALRMRRARESRCYGGRWLWQATVVGQMIGTLFVRAHDRAERVYSAMLARGFTGEPAQAPQKPLRPADYAFLALALGVAILLRAALP